MKAFIIFRDRVSYGRLCAAEMAAAGLEPVIVDHGSTWPGALEWLDETGLTVLRRGGGHPRDLWLWEPFITARGTGRYVVTDPDVVPSQDCPPDWPQRLGGLLDRYPGIAKAALGLRTDNLPGWYSRRQQVIDWESQFWVDEMEPGVYRAPVDTTLALYRERSRFEMDGLRTGHPYVADHLAWHEDFTTLPAETSFYYRNAEPGISHWAEHGFSNWGN